MSDWSVMPPEVAMPAMYLVNDIWSVPAVTKIGYTVSSGTISIWIFIPEHDDSTETRINELKRGRQEALELLPFQLHVVRGTDDQPESHPPFTGILER